jgi:hypothetical protein
MNSVFSNFHDPPSGAYLGPLAEELTNRGVPARVIGVGVTAFLAFVDFDLTKRFGYVYFHQPVAGRCSFIWGNGDIIGLISDIKGAAERIAQVVNPQCTGESTE